MSRGPVTGQGPGAVSRSDQGPQALSLYGDDGLSLIVPFDHLIPFDLFAKMEIDLLSAERRAQPDPALAPIPIQLRGDDEVRARERGRIHRHPLAVPKQEPSSLPDSPLPDAVGIGQGEEESRSLDPEGLPWAPLALTRSQRSVPLTGAFADAVEHAAIHVVSVIEGWRIPLGKQIQTQLEIGVRWAPGPAQRIALFKQRGEPSRCLGFAELGSHDEQMRQARIGAQHSHTAPVGE